jgi:hypothetical protein
MFIHMKGLRMRHYSIAFVLLLTLALFCADLPAQDRKILSPRDSVFLSLDTNMISVNYGRPSMRGRKIMGELVPWNKVWRTGANQATHLRTNFDMTLGGVPVQRGLYTLWTLPSQGGWKIILNKQTGQWGTNYDERQDLARFEATVKTLPSAVETLTVALEPTGKTSGVLRIKWETTEVSAPIEKNTHIRPISPNDSSSAMVDGKRLFVKFSKPYMRGRSIWGVVVPFDSVWRTGANLATIFSTESDLVCGDVKIPKGSYTLYSVPAEKGFTLIISKRPGGSQPQYDLSLDLARLPMALEKAPAAIDPFRIWFEQLDSHAVMLKIGWADRVYSARLGAQH